MTHGLLDLLHSCFDLVEVGSVSKLSKDNRPENIEQFKELQHEFGLCYIAKWQVALIGLPTGDMKTFTPSRKLCGFMNLPSRKQFQAALHFLHHFWCHLPIRCCIFFTHTNL